MTGTVLLGLVWFSREVGSGLRVSRLSKVTVGIGDRVSVRIRVSLVLVIGWGMGIGLPGME